MNKSERVGAYYRTPRKGELCVVYVKRCMIDGIIVMERIIGTYDGVFTFPGSNEPLLVVITPGKQGQVAAMLNIRTVVEIDFAIEEDKCDKTSRTDFPLLDNEPEGIT